MRCPSIVLIFSTSASLNGFLTEKNFLVMLDIVLVTTASIRVSAKDTRRQFPEGGEIQVSDELVSCREDAFRNGISARDGRCVISGVVNRSAPYRWTSWEAAHIFPLEKESLWIQFNYGRWVTDMDDTVGALKINSLYNGFLLRSSVTVFGSDEDGVDGRFLDPVCRDLADPHRVSDQLLRWHFRQSVLANLRGAGEPVFEHDFPPGTDIMAEIREEPYTQEREMEFAWRFRGFV
ncbi:hypothetical protein FN846DRAFT_900423 [Sphaerosporella brunnea]|uniref:HNH nuclease domain-containing protein n=1 Tax=Sphaerosporella brunnea TaxID=1250544 RepID=A0A5J5EJY4_9PEZI|nr:hypothetical protein FN846DRAFT_900423 [Sphaerosporella brunnea]